MSRDYIKEKSILMDKDGIFKLIKILNNFFACAVAKFFL